MDYPAQSYLLDMTSLGNEKQCCIIKMSHSIIWKIELFSYNNEVLHENTQ